MNAYEKAQSLGLTGTDAEQVAVLQGLSQSNISAASVRTWLRQDRDPVLLAWDGSAWYGRLQDLQTAGQLSAPMAEGIRELKTVMLESGELRTTIPGPAAKVWAIVQAIAGILGGDQTATIDSFYSLDGGRPYKALTVQQFAQQRSDASRLAAADQLAAQLLNEHINPALSDPNRTAASIAAAFAAAAAVTP
jgi:hypothetical protein